MMTVMARKIGCFPESRAHYDRNQVQGKTHNQAIRAVGRRVVPIIWLILKSNRDYELQNTPKLGNLGGMSRCPAIGNGAARLP